MSMVNPAENLIRISPPIPWGEIQDGPVLAALEMVLDDNSAVGIRISPGGRTDGWLENELKQVIDHYEGHHFDGHVEIRHARAQGILAERVVVRGWMVARVGAVLGWPGMDGNADLYDLLADYDVHVVDEVDDNPEKLPHVGFVAAEKSDLPERLLAWRDAAVQAHLAALDRRVD